MVTQVPVIGILMIVNGAMCVLYGIFQMAMGPLMVSMMQGANRANPPPPQMDQMLQIMFFVYIGLGILNATPGVMNIVGGIWAMRFRSRTYVFVSLIANVATFASCYCLPTSLGLMVWGLVVLVNQDVIEAFKLGAAGVPVEEIKERMSRYRDDDYDDEDDEDRDSGYDRPPPKPDRGDDGIQEMK